MRRKTTISSLEEAVSHQLAEAPSVEGFLHEFPNLLLEHFPLKAAILYYKEGTGNQFVAYETDPSTPEFLLSEESNLVSCFTSRQEHMILNEDSKIYGNLFNQDTRGILDRLGLNLVLPFFSRQYYRGVLLVKAERQVLRTPAPLVKAVNQCARMIIPMIEVERLELENDRNYYRLFKFDRLVLLGQMAASLAHELKTPMSTVLLEIQEIRDGQLQAEEAALSFKKIRNELIRLNELIESLLSFSRFSPMHLSNVSLADLVRTSLEGIPQRRIPSGLKTDLRLREDLVSHTDRNRLHQVLLNILFNAFDAAGPNGRITISTYSEFKEMKKNIRHIIAIRDDGPGIPQKHKTHVLEPFFTTKENGTGLGLYISYGIMKSLKGDLEIQSSNKGTTVFLILPGETQ